MKLTPSKFKAFQQLGYLEIPHRVIEYDHLYYDQVFNKLDQIAEQGWRNLSLTAEKANDQQNKMLQVSEMWQKNDIFRDLLFHQPLLDVATSLIGPNVQLFHDQALYKPSKVGGSVP